MTYRAFLLFAMVCGLCSINRTVQPGEKDGAVEANSFVRPFNGTTAYFTNEFTAISLDKSHDYTYNPVYEMKFGLRPVWRLSPSFILLAEIGFSTELTDSDFAARRGEVFFDDIPLRAWYQHSIQINENVVFNTGLNGGALIPTSKISRYATIYTVLSLGAQAGLLFPKVLKGLLINWSPKFSKYFQESENPAPDHNKLIESGIPPAEQLTSATFQSLFFAGGINPSWSVANALDFRLFATPNLTLSFRYIHVYTYKYAPRDIDIGSETTPLGPNEPLDAGFNERGIYSQEFAYDLTYRLPRPAQILRASFGALTAGNQVGPDGSYRTPFFNRETVIIFGLSLDIDGTVSAIQGEKHYEYNEDIEQYR